MGEALSITDGLSDEQRQRLEALLREEDYRDGQVVLEEGKPAPGLVMLSSGWVAVQKKDMGGLTQLITELKAPVIVGELELLTGDPCVASVCAKGAVQAKVLPKEAFDLLLSHGDAAAINLMRNLARALGQKLTATDEVYVDMAIWR
jgi:CRP-like cAMP-binding protein